MNHSKKLAATNDNDRRVATEALLTRGYTEDYAVVVTPGGYELHIIQSLPSAYSALRQLVSSNKSLDVQIRVVGGGGHFDVVALISDYCAQHHIPIYVDCGYSAGNFYIAAPTFKEDPDRYNLPIHHWAHSQACDTWHWAEYLSCVSDQIGDMYENQSAFTYRWIDMVAQQLVVICKVLWIGVSNGAVWRELVDRSVSTGDVWASSSSHANALETLKAAVTTWRVNHPLKQASYSLRSLIYDFGETTIDLGSKSQLSLPISRKGVDYIAERLANSMYDLGSLEHSVIAKR